MLETLSSACSFSANNPFVAVASQIKWQPTPKGRITPVARIKCWQQNTSAHYWYIHFCADHGHPHHVDTSAKICHVTLVLHFQDLTFFLFYFIRRRREYWWSCRGKAAKPVTTRLCYNVCKWESYWIFLKRPQDFLPCFFIELLQK